MMFQETGKAAAIGLEGGRRRAGGNGAADGTRGAKARRDGSGLERLLAELKTPSPLKRDEAARDLGELGDPRSATSLAVALADEAHEVRWSAAGALAKLRDPRARDFYLDAIRNGSRADRWAAVWALGNSLRRGDRRALGPLREALDDSDSDVCAAAHTLIGAEPF
jgi:HEAT repeat protein